MILSSGDAAEPEELLSLRRQQVPPVLSNSTWDLWEEGQQWQWARSLLVRPKRVPYLCPDLPQGTAIKPCIHHETVLLVTLSPYACVLNLFLKAISHSHPLPLFLPLIPSSLPLLSSPPLFPSSLLPMFPSSLPPSIPSLFLPLFPPLCPPLCLPASLAYMMSSCWYIMYSM